MCVAEKCLSDDIFVARRFFFFGNLTRTHSLSRLRAPARTLALDSGIFARQAAVTNVAYGNEPHFIVSNGNEGCNDGNSNRFDFPLLKKKKKRNPISNAVYFRSISDNHSLISNCFQ